MGRGAWLWLLLERMSLVLSLVLCLLGDELVWVYSSDSRLKEVSVAIQALVYDEKE